MSTDAQKKAKRAYKAKIKRIVVELYPTDKEIKEHLQQQENVAGYIKQLIRDDMNEASAWIKPDDRDKCRGNYHIIGADLSK